MTVAGNSMRPTEPFVTGVPKVGKTLTVDPRTWSPANVTLAYRWMYWDTATKKYVGIAGGTGKTFWFPAASTASTSPRG